MEELNKELYNALSETLDKIKEVYSSSSFYQHSEYQSKNNGVKNWLYNANLALEKYEKENNINS